MSLPRAVLDSDIIYSRVLHELMGRVAAAGRFITLVWSDDLIAEAKQSLVQYKGLTLEVADRWVSHMTREFPAGEIDISTPPAGVDLPSLTRDPGDEHVCALAIKAGASFLLTHDRGYLRTPLAAYGVNVVAPDVYLTELAEDEPEAIKRLARDQAAAWDGGRPLSELCDAFERAGARVFASKLRALAL